MATPQQASCFLARRPDIRSFICANRPEVCAQGDLAIVQWWWERVLIAPGTPDWDQKMAVGGNLDLYLAQQGCPAAAPTGSPPGGGTGSTPQSGDLSRVLLWVQQNPLLAAGIGLGLVLLLSGRRR